MHHEKSRYSTLIFNSSPLASIFTVWPSARCAADDALADLGLDGALEIPLDRPRAVCRRVRLVGDQAFCFVRHVHRDTPVVKPLLHLRQTQVDDLDDIGFSERPEQHSVINTVKKLRPEVEMEVTKDTLAHAVFDIALIV